MGDSIALERAKRLLRARYLGGFGVPFSSLGSEKQESIVAEAIAAANTEGFAAGRASALEEARVLAAAAPRALEHRAPPDGSNGLRDICTCGEYQACAVCIERQPSTRERRARAAEYGTPLTSSDIHDRETIPPTPFERTP